MSNTTRWAIDTEDNFQNLEAKILDSEGKNLNIVGQRYLNTSVRKGLPKSQKFKVFNRDIIYNYYFLTFNRINKNGDSIPENIRLCLYESNEKLYIILNKNSGSRTFLRKVLDLQKNLTVTRVSNEISSNMIIWLLSRVYYKNNSYEVYDKELLVNSIIGFKGRTTDELSKLTADGDTVMNILSTLSFLLETDLLNQIKIRIEYEQHGNIELKIDTNDTIEVFYSKYLENPSSNFDSEDENEKDASIIAAEHRMVTLDLLVYCEILPLIRQWYNDQQINEKENEGDISVEENQNEHDFWNDERHKTFLEAVAEDLTNQIKEKVEALKQ